MKRLAAHYIFILPDTRLKMHYIELSDDNRLVGVFPLDKEIEQTVFYNGTLILKKGEKENQPAEVYHIDSLELPAAEFGADDCCGNSHIQRLC